MLKQCLKPKKSVMHLFLKLFSNVLIKSTQIKKILKMPNKLLNFSLKTLMMTKSFKEFLNLNWTQLSFNIKVFKDNLTSWSKIHSFLAKSTQSILNWIFYGKFQKLSFNKEKKIQKFFIILTISWSWFLEIQIPASLKIIKYHIILKHSLTFCSNLKLKLMKTVNFGELISTLFSKDSLKAFI